jgi:hypothetical protein
MVSSRHVVMLNISLARLGSGVADKSEGRGLHVHEVSSQVNGGARSFTIGKPLPWYKSSNDLARL